MRKLPLHEEASSYVRNNPVLWGILPCCSSNFYQFLLTKGKKEMLISLILSAKDKSMQVQTKRKQGQLPPEKEYSSPKGIFLSQRNIPFKKEASLLVLGGSFLFGRSGENPASLDLWLTDTCSEAQCKRLTTVAEYPMLTVLCSNLQLAVTFHAAVRISRGQRSGLMSCANIAPF